MSKYRDRPTETVRLGDLQSKHAFDGFVPLADHPFTKALPLDADELVDEFWQSAFEIHAYRRRPHQSFVAEAKARLTGFRAMLASIRCVGFDPGAGGPVVIQRDAGGSWIVAEGRHRCAILHYLYGPDLRLDVRGGKVAAVILPASDLAKNADLIEAYHAGGTRHVGRNGGLYQTVPQLGIPGRRDSRLRFRAYGLADLVKPTDRVLDIGCNCGAMAAAVAPLCRKVNGIDNDAASIAIARQIADRLDLRNVEFDCADADEVLPEIAAAAYNVVLSFAAHRWIRTALDEYGRRCDRILKPGGLCVFESHDPRGFTVKVGVFACGRFAVERWGQVADPSDARREFAILRKPREK